MTSKFYELIKGKLCVTFDFTQQHQQALAQIYANDGVTEFQNRDLNIYQDIDGNSISWRICDELVEMGLIDENEESFTVFFKINEYGKHVLLMSY